ncbi:MAG: HEAT repeat domain-containing protein [Treponema sp.]|jgi:hypothetical protein|nr:HEAT repeat domain-containing protein [Treponema sp.]
MMHLKGLLVLGMVLTVSLARVMGQSTGSEADEEPGMSVEASYRQESVELMIIRELSRADDRDMKLQALENIGRVLEKGNKEEAIGAALEYMAFEGTVNKTRENGRLVNNYPDVRVKVAYYLGKLGTAEAKAMLLKMLAVDYESMVLIEVIKSLTTLEDIDEETINAITRVVRRFDIRGPDSLLALAALEAYHQFFMHHDGIRDLVTVQMIRRISEGPYRLAVRERAKAILAQLSTYTKAGQ